ncbi:MAG: phenylacetate--CoA ligase family protein, partial [Pseudomonadota bacterium]
MKKSFMPECSTVDELSDLQLKGLQWTVTHAYDGSPAYKKKMDEAGVRPGDIRSMDDLLRLPLTT